MTKKNHRAALKSRDGQRFRIRARIERFGQKSAFRGPPVKTLLLRDVVDDNTGQPLTDHVWMTAGTVGNHASRGRTISFDARVG